MTAVTICIDFRAQENKVCFCSHCFPHLFAMKWWDWMSWPLSVPSLHFGQISTLWYVCLSPHLDTAWNAFPLLPSVPLNFVSLHSGIISRKAIPVPFSTFFVKLQCLVLSRNPRNTYWIRDTGALHQHRGVGWRGGWEGGSKGAIYVYLWLIHVEVWQKTTFCKAVILQ